MRTERQESGQNQTGSIPDFLQQFKQSEEFRESLRKYYANKQLAPDVTEQEQIEVFLGSKEAVSAIVDFNEKSLTLNYQPDKLPETSREAVENYIRSVNSLNNATDRDAILELDTQRSVAHNATARTFIEDNLCDNYDVAKIIARLLLVDLELDTPNNVKIMKDRYSYGRGR